MGVLCGKKNKRKIDSKNTELISKYPIKYNIDALMDILNDFINKQNIQESKFEKNDPKDSTYNQLKNVEKEELIKYFDEKKTIFLKKIKNYFEKVEFHYLNDMVKELLSLENGKEIYKQRIKYQIDDINEIEDSFKINYLTVMLLGKSGVGKSTLINSFLKLSQKEKAKTGTGNFQTIDIKSYQSNSLPFLRLVDTRGIELNVKYGADAIKKDAENFIQNQMSSNNINNFVHCFWYCITGNRFEKAEIELLTALRGSYGENKIPIIIVYTQATDDNTIEEMAHHIKESHIDGEFIKVLAEKKKLTNGNYLNSFGLSELLSETLKKCKKALKGEMRTVMVDNIAKYIQNNLQLQNTHVKKYINEKTILDFIKEYKVKTDDEFIDYIINIYGNNNKYFLDNKLTAENFIKIKNSKFFNSDIANYINFYKKEASSTVEKDLNNLAYKLLDIQAKKEIELGTNIENKNRRSHKTFIDSSLLFLNDNFYYLAQISFINYIFKKDILCKTFYDMINTLINNLMNENDVKNNISKSFLKKFQKFENSIKNFSPSFKNINTSPDDGIEDLNNENNEENVDYPSKLNINIKEGNMPAPPNNEINDKNPGFERTKGAN